jgi:hypothetical protein
VHGLEKELVIDVVKEPFDVDIQDPVVTPASLARLLDRINRRAPWPIPVGVLVKQRLQNRFQVSTNYFLGDAVGNCWNAQRAHRHIVFELPQLDGVRWRAEFVHSMGDH